MQTRRQQDAEFYILRCLLSTVTITLPHTNTQKRRRTLSIPLGFYLRGASSPATCRSDASGRKEREKEKNKPRDKLTVCFWNQGASDTNYCTVSPPPPPLPLPPPPPPALRSRNLRCCVVRLSPPTDSPLEPIPPPLPPATLQKPGHRAHLAGSCHPLAPLLPPGRFGRSRRAPRRLFCALHRLCVEAAAAAAAETVGAALNIRL